MYDKVALLDGSNMNVFSVDTFTDNKEEVLNDPNSAIEVQIDGKNYALPIKEGSTQMDKPGVYINNGYNFIKYPSEKDRQKFELTDENSVDFSSPENMAQFMTACDKMHDLENQMLETTGENGEIIYKPAMKDSDSPEMRALKQCIVEKHIDLDKYSSRFGPNFPNDKRKLKDDNITSFLLKRFCENLDIEVDMVFRDRSEDVPNPMNKTISINMVPGNGNNVIIK